MLNLSRRFPGRLLLEEWLALPYGARVPLIWRAQVALLGAFGGCADKRCRRQRVCCGDDPGECSRKAWLGRKARPKTLRQEWSRLDDLKAL